MKVRIIDLELFGLRIFSACMAVAVVRSIALSGGTFLPISAEGLVLQGEDG